MLLIIIINNCQICFFSQTSDSLSDLSSEVSDEGPNTDYFPMPNYTFHAYIRPSEKSTIEEQEAQSNAAVRPKSIAIMGTINESTTDYAVVNHTSKVSHPSEMKHSLSDSLTYSTPNLAQINFHNVSKNTDLSGRSPRTMNFKSDLSAKVNSDHWCEETQVVKKPLTRTSSKFIELGPPSRQKPTKSSFSNDISMYAPKALSGYNISSSRQDLVLPLTTVSSSTALTGSVQTGYQHQTLSPVYNSSTVEHVSVYFPKSYTRNYSQQSKQQQQSPGLKAVKSPPVKPQRSPQHFTPTHSNVYDMTQLSNQLFANNAKFVTGNIEDALLSLKTTLEDYQGQYPELQKLEEQVHYLDRMLKVCEQTTMHIFI